MSHRFVARSSLGGPAMVLLVSQSWLDVAVVVIAFLLLILHADPVTTWLDAVVVLIAFLQSIVLVDRFVNLLPARVLWRSKADLPLDMPLSMMRPGIIVLVSELALRTLFPRWLKVMRFAAEVSWSANRSRASHAIRSVALLEWSRQATAAWTSTSCGSAVDDAVVSLAPSCSSTLLTMPSRTAVGAGSCCTATMTGARGRLFQRPSGACLVGIVGGLIADLHNSDALQWPGLCPARAAFLSPQRTTLLTVTRPTSLRISRVFTRRTPLVTLQILTFDARMLCLVTWSLTKM